MPIKNAQNASEIKLTVDGVSYFVELNRKNVPTYVGFNWIGGGWNGELPHNERLFNQALEFVRKEKNYCASEIDALVNKIDPYNDVTGQAIIYALVEFPNNPTLEGIPKRIMETLEGSPYLHFIEKLNKYLIQSVTPINFLFGEVEL